MPTGLARLAAMESDDWCARRVSPLTFAMKRPPQAGRAEPELRRWRRESASAPPRHRRERREQMCWPLRARDSVSVDDACRNAKKVGSRSRLSRPHALPASPVSFLMPRP